MPNVIDTFKQRGFIKQVTFEEDLYKLLDREKVTFYIGFDPTADSLHVGHFMQVMAMAHMQRAGHRPIALVGGGTAMVGDPSGRTDMRAMMTPETIAYNCECFKKQLSRFIEFGEDKAIMVNNADWLLDLNYVDFLRDIGVHFSVNRMLSAECFKSRMEKGLSFLEFNYMLMQSYDFLVLHQKYGCKLQLGGDDQWSNILSGANLIRVKEQKEAYAMTFTLLTTSDGRKMGKTQSGAVWLDPDKTSPYDFYQYWRNIDDADVARCLRLLTFLPLDEIEAMTAARDERINQAKERLAYELTSMVHGTDEADKADAAAKAAFRGGDEADLPTCTLKKSDIGSVADLLLSAGITSSKSEGRRLIAGGGIKINETKIDKADAAVDQAFIEDGAFIIHKGKKVHVRIKIED